MNNETLVNELTGKNENQALNAAKQIVDGVNTDAFSILTGKASTFLILLKQM